MTAEAVGHRGEKPVPLFTPPTDHPDTPPPGPLPTSAVPTARRNDELSTGLVISVATLTRDGRLRDKHTLTALHWHPGDHTTTHVLTNTLACTPSTSGDTIDNRGQIHIPAGARALHDIHPGDRLLLVALPQLALLLVHPRAAVSDLLAAYYDTLPVADITGSNRFPGATSECQTRDH